MSDIKGLGVFNGTFMTFVGGDSDHETVFYSKIKDFFTVLGWRCSNRTLGFCNNAHHFRGTKAERERIIKLHTTYANIIQRSMNVNGMV
jgi:hypothetical protein